MLLDPNSTPLQSLTVPGTRMLNTDSQVGQWLWGKVMNQRFYDFDDRNRIWTVSNVYSGVRGRRVGGIRVKLEDSKGFVTFCNQRDLEVLMGLAKPGQWCRWMGSHYPDLGSPDFHGFYMDDEDLRDDLLDRELLTRMVYLQEHQMSVLPNNLEIRRRLHMDDGSDYEELLVFLGDFDPNTRVSPDAKLETISYRWARAEKTRVTWSRL